MDDRFIKMISLIYNKQKSCGTSKVTFQIKHDSALPTIIIKDCSHNMISEFISKGYIVSMGEEGLTVTDLLRKDI